MLLFFDVRVGRKSPPFFSRALTEFYLIWWARNRPTKILYTPKEKGNDIIVLLIDEEARIISGISFT